MARSHSDPHSKTWKRSKEPSQLSTNSTHELRLYDSRTYGMVNTRLVYQLEKNQCIPLFQSGFLPDVRFLGVFFDRRLTLIPHILQLRKRCEKSLNLLKVLSNTSWGADRTSLLGVYQAIVLSRIDYGCVVYGSASNSTLKKLDPVHHMALRICSGAFRTSLVQSLYVTCDQLPLDLRRRKLSHAYHFKILSVLHTSSAECVYESQHEETL
ncbi:putative RNA-directed DNA polymerase from transposon X-element [Trichonephila clavipes]|nr:putative RNA-directed DNA polymerase from transposon X-element [Trichonephila clavipes]